MKKTIGILLLFSIVLIVSGCMVGEVMDEAPGDLAPEEPAEEEPDDLPLAATDLPLPTATIAPIPTDGVTAPPPEATAEPQAVYIDLNTVYAEVVDGLPQGSALFNPPDWMQVGKVYPVEVRVVPVTEEEIEQDDEVIATLTVGMEEDRPVVVIPLKVSTVMRAKLSGEAFTIKPLSEEEQIRTESKPYVSWLWEVLPEKAGDQDLTLHLTVVVNAEGMGDKSYTTSEVRKVEVGRNLWYTLGQFMGSNWEWVITGVALPFLGWGGRKVWGRVRGGSG